MSHTPGPWEAHIGPDYFAIYNIPGETVVPEYRCNPETEHDESNARLIAAAPQLLEALKATMITLEENDFPLAAKAIAGVIAKATGGAQ